MPTEMFQGFQTFDDKYNIILKIYIFINPILGFPGGSCKEPA